MNHRADTNHYRRLFIEDAPMMDVRAPTEFAQGAFPHTENLPLLNDQERAAVGTRYKQEGQDAAVILGHQLVRDDIKAQRVSAWADFAQRHPTGYLYCFRGGLRSRLTQSALKEVGIDYPLICGGYKAMRRYLIDELETESEGGQHIIITGRTGNGKTLAIEAQEFAVNLEGIANHKGSTFGHSLTPQPKQIDFENRLAIDFLKQRCHHQGVLFLEDESRLIGRCALPHSLHNTMKNSPVVLIEESMESRLDLIVQEYIVDNLAAYQQQFGSDGEERFQIYVSERLACIQKRLGRERHKWLDQMLKEAFQQQLSHSDPQQHRQWIKLLLQQYYDPMYDYQLEKKTDKILFRGNRSEVIEWASRYQRPKRQKIV